MSEQLYLIDKEGKKRKAVKVICEFCKNEMLRAERFANKGTKFFHRECKAKFASINGTVEIVCAFCGTKKSKTKGQLKNSRSGLYFCNRVCKESAQSLTGGCKEIQPSHYGTRTTIITSDYRPKVLSSREHKCERCGYSKYTEVLEVHHLDRNRHNNSVDNLSLLCPTCHQEWHFENKTGKYGSHNNMGL